MVNCPNNTNTPSAVKTTRARTEEGGTSHLLDEFVPSAKKESLPRTGAESEEGDSSAPGNDHESGGDVGRDTERVGGGGSLFEKRALEKARLRQKDRLDAGEPQVRFKVARTRRFIDRQQVGCEGSGFFGRSDAVIPHGCFGSRLVCTFRSPVYCVLSKM